MGQKRKNLILDRGGKEVKDEDLIELIVKYKNTPTKRFVYFLLWEKEKLVKIGSGNASRICNLQSIFPFETKLIKKLDCGYGKKAYKLEKELHKKYKAKLFKGEWFHFPLTDV